MSSNYYLENREAVIERNTTYYHNNVDKCKQNQHDYYRRVKNSDEYKERKRINAKKYRSSEEYKEKRRKRAKMRYHSDRLFKLKAVLRVRLNEAIKNNHKTGSAISSLGCSIEELREHLESKFKPGMSWDNHGQWHIDHIKPCYLFDLTNIEEQKKCFHYTNLQPLWEPDNLKKHIKYNEIKNEKIQNNTN